MPFLQLLEVTNPLSPSVDLLPYQQSHVMPDLSQPAFRSAQCFKDQSLQKHLLQSSAWLNSIPLDEWATFGLSPLLGYYE